MTEMHDIKTISAKRIKQEKEQMSTQKKPPFIKEFSVDGKNEHLWRAVLLPSSEPFKNAAFCVSVDFGSEFPFKPPRVLFITPIHHPNVDVKGNICVTLLQVDNWKPTTSITTILEAVVSLIDNPEPERTLREDVSEEFVNNRQKFMDDALQHLKKHGEKRE